MEKEIIEAKGDFVSLFHLKDGKRFEERKVLLTDLMKEIFEQADGGAETPLLPCGTRFYLSKREKEIIVVEDAPQTRTILEENGKKYNLAFPYIVYIFYLEDMVTPPYRSRIFYRSAPLSSLDDELLMCNLTHIWSEKEERDKDRKTGAVCMTAEVNPGDSLEKKISLNLRSYWETSFSYFQYQSGFYGGFTEAKDVDSRIMSLVAWEEASIADPLFVLTVPWIKSRFTLRKVIDEMMEDGFKEPRIEEASQLADLIYRIKEI